MPMSPMTGRQQAREGGRYCTVPYRTVLYCAALLFSSLEHVFPWVLSMRLTCLASCHPVLCSSLLQKKRRSVDRPVAVAPPLLPFVKLNNNGSGSGHTLTDSIQLHFFPPLYLLLPPSLLLNFFSTPLSCSSPPLLCFLLCDVINCSLMTKSCCPLDSCVRAHLTDKIVWLNVLLIPHSHPIPFTCPPSPPLHLSPSHPIPLNCPSSHPIPFHLTPQIPWTSMTDFTTSSLPNSYPTWREGPDTDWALRDPSYSDLSRDRS